VIVLQGAAELLFDDETIRMKTGDAILIPARRKHRVEATTSDPPTVWLAVHFDET
jgi:cupin 2 domain-containing protein